MISSTGSSIPMDTLRISPVDICGRPHILRQSSADGPRRRPSLLLFGYAMQLRIKLYDLILAFANALDQVHPALTGHHRRVGFLLDRLAERLGLPSEERERLFLAGIMHDVGVIPLKTSAEDLVFERERYLHPQAGCLFLQNCPTLAEEAERVRFHHMYWEKACDRGLAAREGSLINIADRVDVDLRAKNDFREAVEGADRRVCERRPGIYSPDHIEAMQDLLHDEETLNDLAGAHTRLPAFVRRRYGDQILTPQETIQFSTLFGHIIDSCSPFTATHSTGVAHMAVALGRLTGMGQDDLDTLFVAGMLHDIGKLGIPLALLEKPGQLTDEEFPKVKRHADLSRLWLDAVPGFERVSVWGGGHHERLDGKGYPLGLKGEEIPLPSRIMAIADVFTALTEDRPYRKGMTPPEALRIVKGMVKQGHLDGDLSKLLCDHADELDAVRASSQAEARRGFQALHDACAEPDERLRD